MGAFAKKARHLGFGIVEIAEEAHPSGTYLHASRLQTLRQPMPAHRALLHHVLLMRRHVGIAHSMADRMLRLSS